MGKSKELKNTTELVRQMLQKYPDTRNSDDMLYFRVCESINVIYVNLPFYAVILNRKKYNFPAFESVRRTRQKLQAEFPELAAVSIVEDARDVNEKAFREYAKSSV